jgi:hypothetical protein
MTSTHETSTTTPLVLHADEPAELLAQARLFLGSVPRDSVVLIGHDADRRAPLATMVSLHDVLLDLGHREEAPAVPATDSLLGAQVAALHGHGCAGAFALVVLGDGYEPCADEKLVDLAHWAAAQVVTAAREMDGDFALPEACLVIEGEATRVRVLGTDRDGVDLAVRAEGAIPAVEDTMIAAQAVAAGWVVPDEDVEGRRRLRRVGAIVRTALADAARPDASSADGRPVPDPDRVAASLWRLRRGADAGLEGRSVSECEHLLPMISALAPDDGWNTVLRMLVQEGSVPEKGLGDCPEDVLLTLIEDPRRRPGVNVRAGGSLYEAVVDLRWMLAGAIEEDMADGTGLPESDLARTWVHASVVLGLVAWWNHRFATAGHIAEEIGRRPGREDLARLLTHLTEGPLRPAWRPDGATTSRSDAPRRTPSR